MIKLYSLILFFSLSFTQNNIEDEITSFIESLDDKTLTLTIQKEDIDSDATLSILNEKIFFDTLIEDGTIAIIDSESITTYDFNDKIIIMETVDNTFLDIFFLFFDTKNVITLLRLWLAQCFKDLGLSAPVVDSVNFVSNHQVSPLVEALLVETIQT